MNNALEQQAHQLAITTPYSLSSIRRLQRGLMSADLQQDRHSCADTKTEIPIQCNKEQEMSSKKPITNQAQQDYDRACKYADDGHFHFPDRRVWLDDDNCFRFGKYVASGFDDVARSDPDYIIDILNILRG